VAFWAGSPRLQLRGSGGFTPRFPSILRVECCAFETVGTVYG